jgi:outer membrane protein OmpU
VPILPEYGDDSKEGAMKTIVAATSAVVLLSTTGTAAAQGVDLFGEAFVGLGYNIDNDGGVLSDEERQTPDSVRAISQVRFGVAMTRETDGGIVFGAEIWADDAQEGEGGQFGQAEGSVFVSGEWGTLTYGDVDAADQYWVGDVPGNFSLTGLTDITDTKFISNGGSFGEDSGETFAENPFARPTVRYDFVRENFGISVSTNRDLTDIAVGAGLSADLAGGSWSLGIGYYNFDAFVAFDDQTLELVDSDGDDVADLVVPATEVGEIIPGGEQWSVGLAADYERFSFGATWTKVTSDSDDFGRFEATDLLVGASVTIDAYSVGAFYGKVLSADGSPAFDLLDGDDGYGLTAQVDLGGGVTVNGGIANTYAASEFDTDDGSATIADFGISLNF